MFLFRVLAEMDRACGSGVDREDAVGSEGEEEIKNGSYLRPVVYCETL